MAYNDKQLQTPEEYREQPPEGGALERLNNWINGVAMANPILFDKADCKTLREIADMVERDYVHRVDYEDLRDEFVWTNAFLHRVGKKCGTEDVPSLKAYVEKLESELDQWKKLTANIELPDYPLTQFQPKDKDRRIAELTAELDELKHERDEWKARAEQASESYLCAKDARDYWMAKAECKGGKSTKRAAAVERLRKLDESNCGSFEYAILGSDKMAWPFLKRRDAIIDLLTDDDGAGRGMTHLEWLYRHDAWLRDELERNYGLTEERLLSEHEDGSVVA